MADLYGNTNDLQSALTAVGQVKSEVDTQTDLISKITAALDGKTGGSGIDTSDATATSADIFPNMTAYVNGVKITGTTCRLKCYNYCAEDNVRVYYIGEDKTRTYETIYYEDTLGNVYPPCYSTVIIRIRADGVVEDDSDEDYIYPPTYIGYNGSYDWYYCMLSEGQHNIRIYDPDTTTE